MIRQLTEQIIQGYQITKEEAMLLFKYASKELSESADYIRKTMCQSNFDMCTIINAKSGRCSEDCTYCAQSIHYKTPANVFPLLSKDVIVKDAHINASKGVHRYSLVTSGKKANESEINQLIDTYQGIHKTVPIKLCASHGLLAYPELLKLKEAGVVRYHNNLETSRKHFHHICTTHTYDEKIETIKAAQRAGLEVCSGGIIGLGESDEDRIDLAFELKDLNIQSIPLNLLNPIEGTPLALSERVSEDHFIKIASIYRFIHPKATIRLAGGRHLLTNFGQRLFQSGVNGTISGELLTTYGNDTYSDITMIESLGYVMNQSDKEAFDESN